MAFKDRLRDVDERKIERVIEKGGTVGAPDKGSKRSNFPLRFMQKDMGQRIETARRKRPLTPSINSWINEAILEKLKAEE